jgi:CelD/BcsL family acetyltransferase involved in cellulose biosynthesis
MTAMLKELFRDEPGVMPVVGAPPAAKLPDGRVECHATVAAMTALAGDWRALESVAPSTSVFQSFDWCHAVVGALAAEEAPSPAPRILAFREADGLAALLPLSVLKVGGLRVARGLGEPIAGYADALVRPGREAALDALVAAIRHVDDIDALILRRVPDRSALAAALGRAGAVTTGHSPAWIADLSGCRTPEDHGRMICAKAFRDRARQHRRLDASGTVTVNLVEGRHLAPLLALAFDWKREWLAATGRSHVAFENPVWLAAKAAAAFAPGVTMRSVAHVVFRDGEPLALELGLVHQGRYTAWFGAVRPGLEKVSPTKAAMTGTIAWCLANGIGAYDLLPSEDAYKADWAQPVSGTVDLVLPVSLRGTIYIDLVQRRLRPFARRLMPLVPHRLRGYFSRLRKFF